MEKKIYKKEELRNKKMKELREIGKEYNVNDNDKSELIDEILDAQEKKEYQSQKNKDNVLINYTGQITISNNNPTFSYEFNGKPVAVKKEHAEFILKNEDFREVIN